MAKILITGGSGLIGKFLSEKLMGRGHDVALLSRTPSPDSPLKTYYWSWNKGTIESGAIAWADMIIHLAGENIGKHKWTRERKRDILNSRVKSAEFLFSAVKRAGKDKFTFISASATGYYGFGTNAHLFTEEDPAGKDFLARVCKKWEEAAERFQLHGFRTVIVRTGVVLSKNGGFLSAIKPLLKLGIGIIPGSGKQQLSWIHLDDLCAIYICAVEDSSMQGIYNAVAPHSVSQYDFTKILSQMHRMVVIRIPEFLIRVMTGPRSVLLLEGTSVSAQKIQDAGFKFQYPKLEDALRSTGR
jgi:uncharacterized protein